ncbi:MAG: hypothetical protein JXJ17_06460 [Anaerolineae bacterium]|nr:hypothetical protein [Anaerolineae bacterium]
MNDSRFIIRAGAIGAIVASLLLIGMTFVPWPFDFAMPGDAVIAGEIALSAPEAAAFKTSVGILFSIDDIFLLGWVIAWIGLAALLKKEHEKIAQLTLVVGLVGALLDFSENAIMWSLTQGIAAGVVPATGWGIAWRVVRHLSYLLPYVAAVIAMIGLWAEGGLGRIAAIIALVALIPAIVGLYVPALEIVSSVWYLVWFVLLAIHLWRESAASA